MLYISHKHTQTTIQQRDTHRRVTYEHNLRGHLGKVYLMMRTRGGCLKFGRNINERFKKRRKKGEDNGRMLDSKGEYGVE